MNDELNSLLDDVSTVLEELKKVDRDTFIKRIFEKQNKGEEVNNTDDIKFVFEYLKTIFFYFDRNKTKIIKLMMKDERFDDEDRQQINQFINVNNQKLDWMIGFIEQALAVHTTSLDKQLEGFNQRLN
ncbi:hypothetical protein [Caviibacterium pharyngocola]|uniref:Uncharacterized protein n=1 Tax=Caviibacterium pharyngocola TaxID=28159 RepID=A0A2M8RSV3_9PAST|nr:hypothetical protein [Caviibacterium pharyngocola]PJG81967.1 hypothetical protein CVP04_11330 [Caviibacterium pharyngocola]